MRELAPGEAAFNRLLPHVLPSSRTLGGLAPASAAPAGPAPARGDRSRDRGWRPASGMEGDAGGQAAGTASQGRCDKECHPPSLRCYLSSSTADELLSAYCVPGIVLRVGHAKAGQVRQVPSGDFL